LSLPTLTPSSVTSTSFTRAPLFTSQESEKLRSAAQKAIQKKPVRSTVVIKPFVKESSAPKTRTRAKAAAPKPVAASIFRLSQPKKKKEAAKRSSQYTNLNSQSNLVCHCTRDPASFKAITPVKTKTTVARRTRSAVTTQAKANVEKVEAKKAVIKKKAEEKEKEPILQEATGGAMRGGRRHMKKAGEKKTVNKVYDTSAKAGRRGKLQQKALKSVEVSLES